LKTGRWRESEWIFRGKDLNDRGGGHVTSIVNITHLPERNGGQKEAKERVLKGTEKKVCSSGKAEYRLSGAKKCTSERVGGGRGHSDEKGGVKYIYLGGENTSSENLAGMIEGNMRPRGRKETPCGVGREGKTTLGGPSIC